MEEVFKAGDYLYKLGDKCTLSKAKRVFIYTGELNADGYGVLVGFTAEGKLMKSSGYGNYQYGGVVRHASEDEIKMFIQEVFNYDDPIRAY